MTEVCRHHDTAPNLGMSVPGSIVPVAVVPRAQTGGRDFRHGASGRFPPMGEGLRAARSIACRVMTPDQARIVADELIDQERRKIVARRNAAAKPLPWVYRVPELEPLEPWQRSERLAAARREVDFEWSTTLVSAVFAGLCGAVAWKAGLMSETWSTAAVFFTLSFVPVRFIRMFGVRRRLRRGEEGTSGN